jgi:membrane-associated phospholipid phosphatase
MRRLSRAADHGKLWFGTAASLALLGGPGSRLAARRGLVSLGIASGFANLVAKPLTTRRRPARQEAEELARRHVQMPRSSSFPSGHSASAFAFVTGAARAQPMPSVPLLVLAALVGYSRVHTGVHYPADVLAGAVHRDQRSGADRLSAGPLEIGIADRSDAGDPATQHRINRWSFNWLLTFR